MSRIRTVAGTDVITDHGIELETLRLRVLELVSEVDSDTVMNPLTLSIQIKSTLHLMEELIHMLIIKEIQ